MSYSRILDPKTFGKVVAAAPELVGLPGEVGRKVLVALREQMAGGLVAKQFSKGDGTCWTMRVIELAGIVGVGDETGHQTGRILGELGLQKVRFMDGYHVFWNEAQLDILQDALGFEIKA